MRPSPFTILAPLVLLFAFGVRSHGHPIPPEGAQSPDPTATTTHSNRPIVEVLRSDPISGTSDGKPMSTSLLELTFPPGASVPPHRHPGEVSGYVLEGTLELKIAGQPFEALRPGDTFFEPAMVLHEMARNPDDRETCRVLVTMVHPRDAKRLTILAGNGADAENTQGTDSLETIAETCASGLEGGVSPASSDQSLPTIGILLFDNVLMSEVTAPIDVFTKPSREGKQLFNVITVARSRRPVQMESGLRVVPDHSFEDCPDLNVLVVSSSYEMEKVVASADVVNFIKSKGKKTDFNMSNCAGAHLIGVSGVADGRKIVTYVGGGELLRQSYPNLVVQDDSEVTYVKDGRMVSSNGNLASYISALELLQEMTNREHRKFVESRLYLERLQKYNRED